MIDPNDWVDAVAEAKASGFDWFELLSAYDDAGRSDRVVVVLRLRRGSETQELTTAVEYGGELGDLTPLFAGAAWGQRYVHDFYGVTFKGADLRPLLNQEGGAPLLKSVELAAHAGESRRRRRR